MKKCFLVFAVIATIAPPAFGQVNQARDTDCPQHGDGEIYVHCTITVVGNLSTARAERTEDVTIVNLASDRFESSVLQVAGLQQFRRSDARSANPTSQGVTLRGLGGTRHRALS